MNKYQISGMVSTDLPICAHNQYLKQLNPGVLSIHFREVERFRSWYLVQPNEEREVQLMKKNRFTTYCVMIKREAHVAFNSELVNASM